MERGSIIIPSLIKNMPYLYHALFLVLKSRGHCNSIFNYCIYSKNYLFPLLEYFLVQFIEDNVKFIVDETELRKEDNTTSAMYLDKKYYPSMVLSESGEFLPLFFVYNSFSRLNLPLPFLTVNFMKGSAQAVGCISI